MTRKEMLKKISDNKEEMRSILDKAEREKRNTLTQDEERSFKMLENENEMLSYRLKAENAVAITTDSVSTEKRFAEAIADYYNDGRQVELKVRSIINEATTHNSSTPIVYQELMQPLEKGLIVEKLGCKILQNVHGEPLFRGVSGEEASVVGENEEGEDTKITFEVVKSTPKRISMSIPISNRAINQSNLNLHAIVIDSLSMGVARKLNHMICDVQAHGDYKGSFVDLGDNKITHTGTTFTLKDIVDLEHKVLDAMVDAMSGKSAYVMNTKTASILKTTPIVKGQTAMLLEVYCDPKTNYRWGMMNGYTVLFSNYVPDNTIHFGDFRYLGIPQFGDISIIFDPYTLKKKNAVEFTLNTDMDLVTIRKEAFASLGA